MIKPVTMYSVVCDRCGKPFIDEFNGIVAWLDEGTAKDVVYRVVLSDPSRIFVLDDGTVLKGIVRLENLEDAKLEDEGYLYYGSSYVYSKDIIPRPPYRQGDKFN